MKTIQAYEYKDLPIKIQEKTYEKYAQQEIVFQLQQLQEQVDQDLMTEDEMYKIIGCSKHYAESTSWFVPSVYFDKHKKTINKEVMYLLKTSLFNSNGVFIQNI